MAVPSSCSSAAVLIVGLLLALSLILYFAGSQAAGVAARTAATHFPGGNTSGLRCRKSSNQ